MKNKKEELQIIENIEKGQEDKNKKRKPKERNDINEKELKQDLEQELAEVVILHYTNARAKSNDVKRFVNYLRHCSKDNKSNNSYVNRAFGLYQYLTEQYSNFIELDQIINIK